MRVATWSAWSCSSVACWRNSAATGPALMPGRGEVVALVAQHAHELGGEHLVEHLDHPFPVGAVGLGDGALVDVLARPAPQLVDVGQEVAHGGHAIGGLGRPAAVVGSALAAECGRQRRRRSHLHNHTVYVCSCDVPDRHHRRIGVHGRRAAAAVRRPPRPRGAWSPPATARPAPPIADLYPSLAGAYGDRRFDRYAPELVDGLDLVFLGLPHGASQALVPELVGRVGAPRRPRRRLPAAGRRRSTRSWYGEEHTCPELLARVRLRPARAVPRRHPRAPTTSPRPGCYPTTATLALAPLVRAGLVEPDGIDRRRRQRRLGRRAARQAQHHLLHGRRGLHRLRPARPPPHPRDRAGDRRPTPAAVHARTSRR